MRSLYNRVFKNYQITLGLPFEVKIPEELRDIDVIENEEKQQVKKDSDPSEEDFQMIISKAREQAEFIKKEAEDEASRLLKNAAKEVEQNKAAVFEEAWQKGFREGKEEAKKQYENLIHEAALSKERAQGEYKSLLESIEIDAVNMVLKIVRKVIATELSTNREIVVNMVKEALKKCSSRNNVVLRVSAENFDFINSNREKLLAMVEGIQNLEIEKDHALKEGSFLIKTPYGSIDGSMETKLAKIEEAFKEVMASKEEKF